MFVRARLGLALVGQLAGHAAGRVGGAQQRVQAHQRHVVGAAHM